MTTPDIRTKKVTVVTGDSWKHTHRMKQLGFRFDYERKLWFRFPELKEDKRLELQHDVGKRCNVWTKEMYEIFCDHRTLTVPLKTSDEPFTAIGTYQLYTDGGCWPNPGIGGWAYVLRHKEREVEGCGGHLEETTNNRMELMGPIEGLKQIPDGCYVELFTDSQYVGRGINEWMATWIKHHWRKKPRGEGGSGGPISNVGLWQQLNKQILRMRKVQAIWVKGHAGHKENERCDELAGWAAYGGMTDHENYRQHGT